VRWGAEYIGPLIDGDELLGLIAIAPKAGGGLADALELESLDRMCVTITAALASARLYERLRGLHDELEEKAEARSVSLAKALRDLRGAEQRLDEDPALADKERRDMWRDLGQLLDAVGEGGAARSPSLTTWRASP